MYHATPITHPLHTHKHSPRTSTTHVPHHPIPHPLHPPVRPGAGGARRPEVRRGGGGDQGDGGGGGERCVLAEGAPRQVGVA